MRKNTVYKTLSMSLLVFWMIVIFYFSSQNATQSSNVSSGVVEKIISFFYPEYNKFTAEKQLVLLQTITVLVRKTAHFLEYFILGVLSFVSLLTLNKYKPFVIIIVSTLFCVLYAVSDEIHQFFVPGRACRFVDVCIDSAGSVLSILLLSLIIFTKRRVRCT